MRLFSPPDARKTRTPPGARPPRAQPWVDRAAARAAAGPAPRRLLVADPSGEIALDLLADGHTVTLAAGPAPALAALKVATVRHLPVQSARATLGLDAAGRRIWFLHHLRPHLHPDDQRWWDAREPLARAGIARMGQVEAALDAARGATGLLVPEARELEALVADPDRQRAVGRRLAGRRGLALAARLRAALGEVGGSARGLRDRLAAPLLAGALAGALDHQWWLAGRWATAGPHWLTPAGFSAAKAGLDRLSLLRPGDDPGGPFDGVVAAPGAAVPACPAPRIAPAEGHYGLLVGPGVPHTAP